MTLPKRGVVESHPILFCVVAELTLIMLLRVGIVPTPPGEKSLSTESKPWPDVTQESTRSGWSTPEPCHHLTH